MPAQLLINGQLTDGGRPDAPGAPATEEAISRTPQAAREAVA